MESPFYRIALQGFDGLRAAFCRTLKFRMLCRGGDMSASCDRAPIHRATSRNVAKATPLPAGQTSWSWLVHMHFLPQRQRRLGYMFPLDDVPGCGHSLRVHLNLRDRRGGA